MQKITERKETIELSRALVRPYIAYIFSGVFFGLVIYAFIGDLDG